MNFIHDYSFYFSRPAKVQIDITDSCNLNCVYCYNKDNNLSLGSSEMSDQKFKIVIKKIITELNPLIVTFSGGEPLLRKDLLLSCIQILKENDIEVWINTNGIYIDKEIATSFKELDVDLISINFEGIKPSIHDKIRGQEGAFKKTQKNLEFLKETVGSEKISIATVVNKLNLDQIVDIAKYVKSNDYMQLHLLDMIPGGPGKNEIILKKKGWLKFYEIFVEISKMGIKIKPNHALLFLSCFDREFIFPFCMAGRLKMVICANGDIVPCNYFKNTEYLCGNAIKDNLHDVWKNSEVMNKFRYSLDGYESCSNCNQLKKCAGGCKALSNSILGDPFKADPYCSLYRLGNV